jgi:hypothetical protein
MVLFRPILVDANLVNPKDASFDFVSVSEISQGPGQIFREQDITQGLPIPISHYCTKWLVFVAPHIRKRVVASIRIANFLETAINALL